MNPHLYKFNKCPVGNEVSSVLRECLNRIIAGVCNWTLTFLSYLILLLHSTYILLENLKVVCFVPCSETRYDI